MVISNHNSFRVLFDKIASVFEKNIQILALEMASPGNQHCANCIGTLSFPMETGGRTDGRTDTTDRISFRANVVANYARPAGGQSHFHAKMQR